MEPSAQGGYPGTILMYRPWQKNSQAFRVDQNFEIALLNKFINFIM